MQSLPRHWSCPGNIRPFNHSLNKQFLLENLYQYFLIGTELLLLPTVSLILVILMKVSPETSIKFKCSKLPDYEKLSKFLVTSSKGNDRQMLLTEQRFKSNKLLSISPISYSSRIWNSLPMEAKKAKTLKTFKKSFCTWKLSSYA